MIIKSAQHRPNFPLVTFQTFFPRQDRSHISQLPNFSRELDPALLTAS
ncbi:MAG: hypothetical protein QNL68_02820 [Akkermansiaceae bacterium]